MLSCVSNIQLHAASWFFICNQTLTVRNQIWKKFKRGLQEDVDIFVNFIKINVNAVFLNISDLILAASLTQTVWEEEAQE